MITHNHRQPKSRQTQEIFCVLRGLGGEVVAETKTVKDISGAENLRGLEPEKISDLTLTGQEGERTVVVQLGSPTVVRISSKDDNALVGASQRIGEVLTPCEEEWGAAELARMSLLLAVLLLLFASFHAPFARLTPFSLLTTIALFFTGPYFVRFERSLPRATVVLRWRSEMPPTFWRRHRTTIVINLLTGFVVAFASPFVTEAIR